MWEFREIVAVDFEFIASPGERPDPVCLVAHELRSGRRFRLWHDQFRGSPPYATGPDVLFVAYFASADLGCYRVLGWETPPRILDPFVEFRVRTNGLGTPAGHGLLGALTYFGLDTIGAEEKADMRALVMRGGPWSEAEREAILDYCESDVVALARLLPAMQPDIDLPRALLRGRYTAAVAKTWSLACWLLYYDWKGKGAPVKLANGMLKIDGISRCSKWRALNELERLGLIEVERRNRRSPIVRVVRE